MPAPLRVHIASFARPDRWTLDRIVWLTPSGIETIVADALRAGRGVEVEVTVPPETTPAMLASLRIRLARVTELGIPVHIRMPGETSQRVAG